MSFLNIIFTCKYTHEVSAVPPDSPCILHLSQAFLTSNDDFTARAAIIYVFTARRAVIVHKGKH
jgi:hypothetical protein